MYYCSRQIENNISNLVHMCQYVYQYFINSIPVFVGREVFCDIPVQIKHLNIDILYPIIFCILLFSILFEYSLQLNEFH